MTNCLVAHQYFLIVNIAWQIMQKKFIFFSEISNKFIINLLLFFWAPKKHFSDFLFSVVFQHVVNSSSDQQFHNPSNYSNGLEYKNVDRREKWRQRLKQKKKLSTKNLFIHLTIITDDASIHFFFYVNSFHCFI